MATAFRAGFKDGVFPELSGRDFDAYLAARILTPTELATIDAVSAVVVRTKLRNQVLVSDEIRRLLRDAIEPDLKELEAHAHKP